MNDPSQAWGARPQQAAIVLAPYGAVSRIHGVLQSERGFSPVLINAGNMRECGGLLFQPRRELTRGGLLQMEAAIRGCGERGQAYAIAAAQWPRQRGPLKPHLCPLSHR